MKVRKILMILAFACTSSLVIAACNFFGVPGFNGSGGCTQESCGFGYTITSYDAWQKYCYVSMDTCCACNWQNYHCQCWFGFGSGRDATKTIADNSICSDSWTMPCVAF